MAQQSSNNRAFVTSYRLEEKQKPESKTDEKKEDPPMPLAEKQELLNSLMVRYNKGDEPEIEVV